MSRIPTYRTRTGHRRRGAKRNHSRDRRIMHLSHAQVGFMSSLQQRCYMEGSNALIYVFFTTKLLLACAYAMGAESDYITEQIVIAIVHVRMIKLVIHISRFDLCQYLDYVLHDIPPEEEAAMTIKPRQNIVFESWSDWDCYHYTNFHKEQLARIFSCFGLQAIIDPITGKVQVPTGYYNQRGVACYYNFHPEELFFYTMTRMKTGNDHTQMCGDIFGGSPKRWSIAWRWVMKYLDDRYQHVIGHQGLLRYVDQFAEFFDAIQQKVQQQYKQDNHDGTYNEADGLAFLPFDIFGFIDCSIDKISRPFSGPRGDYPGAGRRNEYSVAQRAFYTGYKKIHGIKVETVFLPNGISTVFGPVSSRLHDVNGVLQMSNLNEFLVSIQEQNQHEYQALGDSAYGINLRCIRSYFKSFAGQPPLTAHQMKCNAAIKRCRQSIEWSYGDVSKYFSICAHPKHNMLAKKNPYAIEQLRVAHLLCNIYTCLNGDKASGHNGFCCKPPRLEDYLRL